MYLKQRFPHLEYRWLINFYPLSGDFATFKIFTEIKLKANIYVQTTLISDDRKCDFFVISSEFAYLQRTDLSRMKILDIK